MLKTNNRPSTASTNKFYQAVWRWHFYAGLFVLPFLLVLTLSGLFMLLSKPIENYFNQSLTHVTPEKIALSASTLLHTVRNNYPDATVRLYVPGQVRTAHASSDHHDLVQGTAESTKFSLQMDTGHAHSGHGAPSTTVYINPYNGEILGESAASNTPYTWLKTLHGNLFIGDVGDNLIEASSGLAIMMIFTGLYMVWSKTGPRIQRPKLAPAKREDWRNLHKISGLVIAIPLLFFLISGLAWTNIWGGKLVQPWSSLPGTTYKAPKADVVQISENKLINHQAMPDEVNADVSVENVSVSNAAVDSTVVDSTVVDSVLVNGVVDDSFVVNAVVVNSVVKNSLQTNSDVHNHKSMNLAGAHLVPWAIEQTPLPVSNKSIPVKHEAHSSHLSPSAKENTSNSAMISHTAIASNNSINLDTVANIAHQIGFNNYRVHFPKNDTGTWTISASTIAGDITNPSAERTVHIDQYSGALLADLKFADYPVMGMAMSAFIPFHQGDFGWWNWLLNLVLVLMVLLLIVSGTLQWWKRRPTNQRTLAAPKASPQANKIVGMIMLLVALFFPLSAAALIIMIVLDKLIIARFKG